MNINLSISAAPTILNRIAIVAYKAKAPSLPITFLEYMPPHSSQRDVTLLVPTSETYIVNIYETTGFPSLGTLRHSFIYDPSYAGAEIIADEVITMGLVNEGMNSYITAISWEDLEVQTIERRGFGSMIIGEDYILSTDINNGKNNGFILLNNGDVFQNEEVFIVSFKPKLSINPPIQQGVSVVTSEFIVSNNTILTEANSSSLIRLAGDSSVFDVTLPRIGLVSSFISYYFVSTGGIHITSTINAASGQFIFFNGSHVSKIHLCQGEHLTLINNGIEWVAMSFSSSICETGQIVYDYRATGLTYPSIIADGCANSQTLLDRNVYRRLYDYVSGLMPLGSLISETIWASNRGFYSNGDGLTNFRLPQLYSTGYLKAIPITGDGSAGRYQQGALGAHRHHLVSSAITIGETELTIYPNRAIAHAAQNHGQFNYALDMMYTEENAASYEMTSIQATLGLSSLPTSVNGLVTASVSQKNITDNTGIFALIRI